ncbi:Mur ligase domain-containing protein [Bacillus shivajii]|uniref:Mur ligase family protein n=1 Tax=Bacillus shivajii TaxID=1983719 RepID=UPI001CF9E37D|nr:Mur ligase family protein [Bacillus shivajii]UCZ51828.1 Mur ligase domain-containing protein [Bacillus shivajii]
MASKIPLQLLREVSSKSIGNVSLTFMVEGVSIDASNVEPGNLFIPLESSSHNGEKNLEEAIEKGAKAALWPEDKPLPDMTPNNFVFFVVDNTRLALQRLASHYLNDIDPIVICVTGNDKVQTTTSMITSILSKQFNIHQSIEGVTPSVSIPLSMLQMPEKTDVFIYEMISYSIDEVMEINNWIVPNYMVLATSNEKTKSQVTWIEDELTKATCIEKNMKATAVLILDGDEASLKRDWKTDPVYCGFDESSLFHITHLSNEGNDIHFQLSGLRMNFILPSHLQHVVKNSVFAIALSVHLGVLPETIAEAIGGFSTIEG